MDEPVLPVTGIVGIPVKITGQPALKNSQVTKNHLIKRLLGGNRHEVANHIAATNQPIQKVNTLFGLIVTKDQVVMADQHARISHLVKKLRRINLPAMIGPRLMEPHPKKAGKQARRPLHVAKRNLSVVNQSLTNGLTLAINHSLGCLDQTNQKMVHHGDLLCQKNAAVEKAMHPHKAAKAH